MNKKILVPALVVAGVLIVGAGAACWYLTTPNGKDWKLNREFHEAYETNRADHFRQALPTILPKDRPTDFEFYYENRDDQADYAEAVLISATESFVQVSTKGEVKKTPVTLSEETLNTLYQAIQTIPFDQIKLESIPMKLPSIEEIKITDEVEKPNTKKETLRVSYGSNMADRQNLVYIEGASTKITDESRPNWDRAKDLVEEILEEYGPKK